MKTKLALLTFFGFILGMAQHGVSSGSYSMFQANGFNSQNEFGNFNERMIIVEDFVNFHQHKIKIPTNEKPEISIDYNNSIFKSKDKFLLQIGIATAPSEFLTKSDQKANISLVVDNSGSMQGQKINFVKNAMKTFVEKLDNGTTISIIVFNSNATIRQHNVILNNDRSLIYQAIENIHSMGSTNINEGMILGYEEISKVHKFGMNSRLILLTDGMTNQGETNHEAILANSKKFNDLGIEISTIGVGQSIDFDLLRNLAENGNGSNHFIGDSETDIQKVFVNELESLVYNLGKKTNLKIDLGSNLKVTKIYGYQPNFISNHEISIKLENLNAGSTQVILLEVEKLANSKENITVELTYEKDSKIIKLAETQKISKESPKITNPETTKNYAIALMADSLKLYAAEFVKGDNANKTIIQSALKFTQENSDLNDPDIKRIYDLLKLI